MDHIIRLGTRGSDLARWQTNYIKNRLERAWSDRRFEIEVYTTRGDTILDQPLPAIGGKGLFTAELEAALREGRIDLAVHSLKDLPTESPDGLIVGAIPERADVRDALVSRDGHTLATLPQGAIMGTSSRRRAAQLLSHRPDLVLRDIRGNVPTRVRKALAGDYDGVVLACAGLERLDMLNVVSEALPLDVMLPAPGQGALGVQCRNDSGSLALLQPIDHAVTRLAVTAERSFLAELGGGCAVPIAAFARIDAGQLRLCGRVSALDGLKTVNIDRLIALTGQGKVDLAMARQVGEELAQQALTQGAAGILEAL